MAKDRVDGKDLTDKSLHFFVPVDFHRRLKMVCAYEGETLKKYVMEALQGALSESEKRIAAGGAGVNSISSSQATSG